MSCSYLPESAGSHAAMSSALIMLYAQPMRQFRLFLIVLCLAPFAASAQNGGDDLGRFITSRGLGESTGNLPGTSPSSTSASPAAGVNLTPFSPVGVSQRMSELVVSAMGALGIPYQRGGSSYAAGFDCSGFVRAVYEQTLGLLLPRQAAQQAAATHPIDAADLKPGDLVFFNTMRRTFSHVGIYVGDNKFIHSPKPGAAVRIEDMRVAYWNRRFDGARRVDENDGADSTATVN
jgi:cell wall-associated NlpC family hydrolase